MCMPALDKRSKRDMPSSPMAALGFRDCTKRLNEPSKAIASLGNLLAGSVQWCYTTAPITHRNSLRENPTSCAIQGQTFAEFLPLTHGANRTSLHFKVEDGVALLPMLAHHRLSWRHNDPVVSGGECVRALGMHQLSNCCLTHYRVVAYHRSAQLCKGC